MDQETSQVYRQKEWEGASRNAILGAEHGDHMHELLSADLRVLHRIKPAKIPGSLPSSNWCLIIAGSEKPYLFEDTVTLRCPEIQWVAVIDLVGYRKTIKQKTDLGERRYDYTGRERRSRHGHMSFSMYFKTKEKI